MNTFRRAVLGAAAACALSSVARAQDVTHSKAFTSLQPAQVPVINRSEYTNLIEAGVLDTDGWTYLVLNVAGEMKGTVPGGSLGVILVPDLAIFRRAFLTLGVLPASHEMRVALSPGAPLYFLSAQQRFEIGFPRYRVYYYNETGQGVTLSLFAYRTR